MVLPSSREPSDAALIQRFREGDDAALDALVTRHRDALYRFCCRLVSNRDDAEDICQESLTRAVAHVDSIQTGHAFRSWLYTTARNLSTDAYRKRGRTFPLLEQEVVPQPLQVDGPQDRVEVGEEQQTVAEALGKLRENYRRVLVLREVEGLSYADIARRLNVSQSAVEALLFRARRRLREEYDKHDLQKPGIAVLAGLRTLLMRSGLHLAGGTPLAKLAVTAGLIGVVTISARATFRNPSPAHSMHVAQPVHADVLSLHPAIRAAPSHIRARAARHRSVRLRVVRIRHASRPRLMAQVHHRNVSRNRKVKVMRRPEGRRLPVVDRRAAASAERPHRKRSVTLARYRNGAHAVGPKISGTTISVSPVAFRAAPSSSGAREAERQSATTVTRTVSYLPAAPTPRFVAAPSQGPGGGAGRPAEGAGAAGKDTGTVGKDGGEASSASGSGSGKHKGHDSGQQPNHTEQPPAGPPGASGDEPAQPPNEQSHESPGAPGEGHFAAVPQPQPTQPTGGEGDAQTTPPVGPGVPPPGEGRGSPGGGNAGEGGGEHHSRPQP